jgi:hypothetical protein
MSDNNRSSKQRVQSVEEQARDILPILRRSGSWLSLRAIAKVIDAINTFYGPVETKCTDPGWEYDKGRGMICTGCRRSATEILTVEMENQTPENKKERGMIIATHIERMQKVGELSSKQLVDLTLEHVMDDLNDMQELLVEELCSRVHPNWEKEISDEVIP